jgi:hypothetical protein
MGWRSAEADKTEWRGERQSPMEGLPSGERNSSAWGSFRRGHVRLILGPVQTGNDAQVACQRLQPTPAPDDERVA